MGIIKLINGRTTINRFSVDVSTRFLHVRKGALLFAELNRNAWTLCLGFAFARKTHFVIPIVSQIKTEKLWGL